jgi:hypothetical protein
MSILNVLRLPNSNDSISIECVEDIDLKTATETTAVQCKYYAKTAYSHSKIKEAVRYMLSHFKETKSGKRPVVRYAIRGHYSSGQEKLSDGIDVEFLKENYTDVKLDDPTDTVVQGRPAMELTGTGKDKDGNAVQFLSAVIALGPLSVAEIWAAVFPEGNDDLAAAKATLASFMPAG